jgi:putative hydrolase of the HAD superfamily
MGTGLKSVQAITFDAGGTLLYPYPSVGAVYSEVMRRHGLSLRASVLEAAFRRAWNEAHRAPRIDLSNHGEKKWWRYVVRQTLNGLGEPRDFNTLFEELWHTFAEPRRWRLYGGARKTLEALRSRGYRLAVLSNWDARLRKLMDGLNLTHFFEHLVISCEVEAEKPDPRIFRAAERLLAVAPGHLLHVGDSVYHDVEGARRAGWHAVRIDHRRGVAATNTRLASLEQLLDRLPGI